MENVKIKRFLGIEKLLYHIYLFHFDTRRKIVELFPKLRKTQNNQSVDILFRAMWQILLKEYVECNYLC